MSTSFLYHAFGLPSYDYIRQEFVGGNVLLHVRPKGTLVRCPSCRSRDVLHRGLSKRWLRTVPVGFKPVWLVVELPRIGCASCGLVRRIELRIAEPRRRHTKAFARFVLALTKAMTMLDVARLLGVGWDVAKDILKRHLQRRFGRPKLYGKSCLFHKFPLSWKPILNFDWSGKYRAGHIHQQALNNQIRSPKKKKPST